MLAWQEIIARLLLACLLGGVIGWERQRRARAAGLRTHMLVALGSALIIIVSAYGFEDILKHPSVVLDPSRIAAQVVSGIGFLGAGAILFMHRTEVVRGLTTAAGLWTVAAIGLAAGAGLYLAAAAATVIAWMILVVLKMFESRFLRRGASHRIRISGLSGHLTLGDAEIALRKEKLSASQMIVSQGDGDRDSIDILIQRGADATAIARAADALRAIDGALSVQLDWPRE